MGWLVSYEKLRHGETVDSRMRENMSWSQHDAASGERHEIIASATVGSTWYAAVKHTLTNGTFRTFALVCLTSKGSRRPHDGFGYKDMTENMGPCECSCPMRILDLLTPTDAEYANDWRQRCRDRAKATRERRASVPKPGARVTFNPPLNYGGTMIADFIVIQNPPRTRGLIAQRADGLGGIYRLPTNRLTEAHVA